MCVVWGGKRFCRSLLHDTVLFNSEGSMCSKLGLMVEISFLDTFLKELHVLQEVII